MFSKNRALGDGPFEREFKLITMPLQRMLEMVFQSQFLTLADLTRDNYFANYWGARFLERWNLNRWPLRRSDSTEIRTLGSVSLISSNHESVIEQE